MRLSVPRITVTGLAAGVGSGLAAVLLSMITLEHPPLTVAMGFVAPLPVMIAALGFGWTSGVLSLLVGAILIGAFDLKLGAIAVTSHVGTAALDVAVFFVALGVPALILARLAARPADDIIKPSVAMRSLRPEERQLGNIVLASALFSTLSVALLFAIAIHVNGGFEAFNATMVKAFEEVWKTVAESRPVPAGLDVHKFAVQLSWAIAPLMAAALVVFYVLNLWLAARTAQTSGLLGTPWTDIPRYLRLPKSVALVLAVALGLSFVSGLVGFAARIVSAALVAALALQGLAVIHALTRGRSFRLPLLVLVYMSLVMLFPWPFVLWGFFGLLDLAFSFRDRHQSPPGRPDKNPPKQTRSRKSGPDAGANSGPKSGPWGPNS